MTLAELVRAFRVLAHDTVHDASSDRLDLLWQDADIRAWLNEGQREACVRARLLVEAENPDVCRIDMVRGKRTYPLHPKLIEIISARYECKYERHRAHMLWLKTREWLDRFRQRRHEWEGAHERAPLFAVQDETSITLIGRVHEGDVLWLEAYRLPMQDMQADGDTPEIHEASHRHLVDWALYRAFGIPDSEAFDAERSDRALADFTRYFGLPVNADMRRSTRFDITNHTKLYLP